MRLTLSSFSLPATESLQASPSPLTSRSDLCEQDNATQCIFTMFFSRSWLYLLLLKKIYKTKYTPSSSSSHSESTFFPRLSGSHSPLYASVLPLTPSQRLSSPLTNNYTVWFFLSLPVNTLYHLSQTTALPFFLSLPVNTLPHLSKTIALQFLLSPPVYIFSHLS